MKIKSILSLLSIAALAFAFTGCEKSDEEKCKDGDISACQKAVNKAVGDAQKELNNIKLP